ncbi:MAG: DinB family protein [Chloroflexi bacterium]|nr:DinB family protein [Chloroflexota bacterium]MCI0728412.1 DinB family protein [Chloroflexota bacterium]
MHSDQLIREQLLALLAGGNAHMSFDQAIADFPPQHFNSKPPRVPYTSWHILEHLRIAQWDILEFIRNPAHVSPHCPASYWPYPAEEADSDQWEKTIREFRADLQALANIVTDSATELATPLPHAPGYTIFREILVVADHNAYHIGEFAILRQVMGTWPAAGA